MKTLSTTRRVLKGIIPSMLLIALLLPSCKREEQPLNTGKNDNLGKIPETFDFATTKEFPISISALDELGSPIHSVIVQIYTAHPENGGKLLYKGITNQSGALEGLVRIPTYIEKVVVNTNYIGLPNNLEVPLNRNSISVRFSGAKVLESYREAEGAKVSFFGGAGFQKSSFSYSYFGTWNADGVPNYLVSPNDVMGAGFLNRINKALPETMPVPAHSPQFLDTNSLQRLVINQTSDVWVTFVHEGASLRNTLGFYLYNKNSPPQSVGDISNVKVIFPNTSYINSGGGLVSGNKVQIGRFGADTVIGFVLIANGFNINNATVGTGSNRYFTDWRFNPESNVNIRQHHVMLFDDTTDRMVIGFEDIRRDLPNCDQDFNDLVFYVTTNPVNSYDTTNVNKPTPTPDCDNDGVPDALDDYPCDPERAFDNHYPAPGVYGTHSFEDLWPGTGDYDMNDLNIGYNYIVVTNSLNRVKDVKASYMVRSAGASFRNGFGVELNANASAVASVTGHRINMSYLTMSGGLEAGHTKAVMIPFDNHLNIISRPSGRSFINTVPGDPLVDSDTVKMVLTFTSTVTQTQLGSAPFNPFIIPNLDRNKEVHLPNYTPTVKANISLLGTSKDASIPAMGIYYKTADGMPWAIDIPETFAHPSEKSNITNAHLRFAAWATSNGINYPDWYQNKPGYRNPLFIY